MKRWLVTGGCGFIGSAVCRHLVGRGQDVWNIDKLTYAGNISSTAEVASSPHYHFVQADIVDALAVRRVFDDFKPDAVLHLAAESHVDRSITGAGEFVRTNVVGTFTMLEEARRHRDRLGSEEAGAFRFLHVSTDEVYGSLGPTGLFSETSAYDPRSPYAASKASADHLASSWWHTYGLPVLISNCSNNYGPYHYPEKLIPLTILNALEGQPISVYGDGANVRDWLYVGDHAAALEAIINQGVVGEKYNVGGSNERSNLEVVHAICDLVDEFRPSPRSTRELIRFVTDRPGHDQRYAIDATKLQTTLGWKAENSFDQGLRKTVTWFMQRQDWWLPLRQAYAGERLGTLADAV